jgi:uncharacterized protein YaiI (UPF0178 family)
MKIKNQLKIWIDADACPVVIKEILFKAADRQAFANHLDRWLNQNKS